MTQTRPAPTTLAFHASRIVIDVGVLLTLGGMSLPFVLTAAGDRSAIDLDALPVLLLLAPVFIVTLLPDHTRPLHPVLGWGALVLGLAAFPYAIVKYLDAGLVADSLSGSIGNGARLVVLGSFVTLVGIAIGLARSWMGLPSGGTPGRRAAVTTRSRRRRRSPGTEAGTPGERPRSSVDLRPEGTAAPSPGESRRPPATLPREEPPRQETKPMRAQGTQPVAPAAQQAQRKPEPDTEAPPADQEPERRPLRANVDDEIDIPPFVEPLFDSLEIPTPRVAEPDVSSPELFFQSEQASERVVEPTTPVQHPPPPGTNDETEPDEEG